MKYLIALFLLAGCASSSDVVKVLVEDVNNCRQVANQYMVGLQQCQAQLPKAAPKK